MKMREINNERLLESQPGHKIRNVKAGDIIRIKENVEDGRITDREIVPWEVQRIYPYFVYATHKKRHKCINYGTLIQLGVEKGIMLTEGETKPE